MWKWLDRISDESHESHAVAARYHLGYVVVYGVLVALYLGAMSFHWSATKRHWREP